MSAGKFKRSLYETDKDNLVGIRIQPETESLTIAGTANTPPAGTKDPGFPSARVGGGRNKDGINARLVRFKFDGTAPDGYDPDGTITLPVLSKTLWLKIDRDVVGTYAPDGTAHDIIVTGYTPEKIR